MAVPRLIEFIESLARPGAGVIAEHGGIQVIVPVFPPNTTSAYTVTPPTSAYALITYRVSFGAAMVPNVFTGWFEHAGRHRYIGTITNTVIRDGLEWYLVITDNEPLRVSVTNVSGLNQYFEEISQFALVPSRDDYLMILEALDILANKTTSELQREANMLLKIMAGEPRPPIGGQ